MCMDFGGGREESTRVVSRVIRRVFIKGDGNDLDLM